MQMWFKSATYYVLTACPVTIPLPSHNENMAGLNIFLVCWQPKKMVMLGHVIKELPFFRGSLRLGSIQGSGRGRVLVVMQGCLLGHVVQVTGPKRSCDGVGIFIKLVPPINSL